MWDSMNYNQLSSAYFEVHLINRLPSLLRQKRQSVNVISAGYNEDGGYQASTYHSYVLRTS